jgi:conjugal transfer/entry exclusion protein
MVLALVPPPKAAASIFGEENATLAAILGEDIAQLAEMVKTVASLGQQIARLESIIAQGETVLRSAADIQGLDDLIAFTRHTQSLVRRFDSDVRLLQYKLDKIDRAREKIFPDLEDVPSEELPAKARTWNAALKESSKVAMRAQTSVETLQARMDRMENLLRTTDTSTGVVETLQTIVRALGVLHADLAAIEANIATGQRVTATMAGIEAAEAERSDVMHTRMMDGYTNRGAPANPLKELP